VIKATSPFSGSRSVDGGGIYLGCTGQKDLVVRCIVVEWL